jgi:hypothetical protein
MSMVRDCPHGTSNESALAHYFDQCLFSLRFSMVGAVIVLSIAGYYTIRVEDSCEDPSNSTKTKSITVRLLGDLSTAACWRLLAEYKYFTIRDSSPASCSVLHDARCPLQVGKVTVTKRALHGATGGGSWTQ